jgi:TRAP-type C4-dicarboxylate transport system substrate-binding protein
MNNIVINARRFTGIIVIGALFALWTLAATPLFAEGQGDAGQNRHISIKLASLVPELSPWGTALNKMSRNILAETDGNVEVIVYHNGVAGGESDALRKLRLNQIQAAILTSFGLNEITPEILTLSCPFLIRTNGELDYVLQRLKPALEARINRQGFQTIAWSKVGFVSFFSKIPARTPNEMRAVKLGVSDVEVTMINVFKSMGYQLVPLPMDQSLIALHTNRSEAVYTSPLSAASFQLFATANNMMDFPIAPFMGGIVMNQTAWRGIPENYQAIILKHAKIAELEMDAEIQTLEQNAIDMMKKNGLNVYHLTPTEEALWISDTEKAIPRLLGPTFDTDIYRQVVDLLKEYRAGRR